MLESIPHIITVCGDPGGATALAVLIKKMEEHGDVEIINFTYNHAVKIFKNYNIKSIQLNNNIDAGWIKSILKKKCSLLLTATSHNDLNFEKSFIHEAKKLNIFSIALLDFWTNYRLRFEDNEGNLKYLPNIIAVMDEKARNDMISLGFPEKQIIITGQPAFDSLAYYSQSISTFNKTKIRRTLNVSKDELLVMFLSQPLKEVFGGPDSLNYLGYDEQIVLQEVIKSLDILQETYNKKITLLIRPHPREKFLSFHHCKASYIKIILSRLGDGRDSMLASDLIIGMNTALLIDACYLSCRVVSVQPGLLKEDSLPTNMWGASKAVYNKKKLVSTIEAMLFDKIQNYSPLAKCPYLDGKAAEKLMKYIYNALKIEVRFEF